MRPVVAALACVALSSAAAGCSTVPPLSAATNNFPFTSSIPIHDIVQRVKCELSDALDEKTQQPQFRWMASWTAKADLTLEVNDSAGISPSATFIQPLHNAFFFGVGPSSINTATGAATNVVAATPQNFNLGFGANLSGSADRTELLSFTVSVDELRKFRRRLREQETRGGLPPNSLCYPVGVNDLQGGLDLKSWIDSALEPVGRGDLAPGNHPAPGTVAKAPSAKPTSAGITPHGGAPMKPEDKAPYDARMTSYQAQIKTFMDDANKAAGQAFESATQVRHLYATTHLFDRQIRDLAYWARQQAIATQLAATDALKYADDAKPNTDHGKEINKAQYDDDLSNVAKDLQIAALNADAAGQNAALAAKLANPDPPIDSITHSLQFIVAAGGSISPNWTFLHWKGPAQSGSLASLSGIRTHSLNIALGSPTGGGLVEVNRVLGNQALRQAVQTIGAP
jgi:hypothetical protein